MLLDVEFHGNGIAIFRATRGELHASSLQRLEELCEVMQRQGKVGIILELSGLRHVSASGLAALVELVSLRRGQEIGICSAPEKLVQLIEQLGLYRGLPLYPDLESTLRSDQFQRCHLRGLRSLVLCSTRSRGALDQAGPAEMLDVLGKPLLHRVLDKLASHGCSIAYLKAGKDARKLASYFSVERVTGQSQFLLGTEMGAASEELGVLLRHLVDSQIPDQADLLILPADQLNEADLGAFVEQHRKAQADLSVLVTEEGTKGAACVQDIDLWEPSAVLIRPGQIPQLPAQGCQSLADLASYMRCKKRKVVVCRTDCRFLPIGDEISYHAALASLMSSTMNNVQPKARELGHGIWQAEGSHVSVDAKIDGPVFVGEGAEVPRDVRIIGPAVIGAGVRIPSKTLIRNSVILSDKSLQIGALVDGKLVLSDRQVSLTAPGTARDILPIQHAIENLDDIEVSQERMA